MKSTTIHGEFSRQTSSALPKNLVPSQIYNQSPIPQSRREPRQAFDAVVDYAWKNGKNGTKPRYRGNRLIFVAPDHGALKRLRDCIRVALAWNSIVEGVAAMRLVLDNLQAEQAKKELKGAEDVLPRVARECQTRKPFRSAPARAPWDPRSRA